jgi:hypothetical protein
MLADFFSRGALAAAQVLEGFDLDRFRAHLDATPVGVSVGAGGRESRAGADMTIRLLARLYPKIAIRAGDHADAEALRALADAINPAIEIVDEAQLGIVIGDGEPFAESISVGSDGWIARFGTDGPFACGDSPNPIGPGVAGCLGAGALFRRIFLPERTPERDSSFNAFTGAVGSDNPPLVPRLGGEAVMVGAGAIGNGAIWALSRAQVEGVVHVVDHESIELSNLQRYVLGVRADDGEPKVDVVTRDSATLSLRAHRADLAGFLTSADYSWHAMLLGLDSARDRVSAQASLPRWIANAWTQPGDLGVSTHSRFGGDGACVACQYLPVGAVKNEDQLVAETLGVPHLLMDVRTLLHTGGPLQRALLEAVAEAIGRPVDVLLPFEGRPVRELYVEGFCGGAVIPLGEAGRLSPAAHDVHVPLAHQSALAGVLLAAALLRNAEQGLPEMTTATRIDVLRPLGSHLTLPARVAGDGRCICEDADFRSAYDGKY